MENLIYAYTRKQALEDGEQVDVSTTAAEAGIRFPVFLTRAVYDAYVTVPPNVTSPPLVNPPEKTTRHEYTCLALDGIACEAVQVRGL